MATLDARLTALEATTQRDPARLLILGRYGATDSDIIGIRASGPRLPDDVPRLPGESIEELQSRVALMTTEPGPLLTWFWYADD